MKVDGPLPEYFVTTPAKKDGWWVIKCRRCATQFEVKDLELRPGALLTLLNHAHSHK